FSWIAINADAPSGVVMATQTSSTTKPARQSQRGARLRKRHSTNARRSPSPSGERIVSTMSIKLMGSIASQPPRKIERAQARRHILHTTRERDRLEALAHF